MSSTITTKKINLNVKTKANPLKLSETTPSNLNSTFFGWAVFKKI